MALATHATLSQRAWHVGLRLAAGFGFAFLLVPIIIIIPISFSSGTFLNYPLPGLTLKWYEVALSPFPWISSFQNSVIIAIATTVFATVLGTMAAVAPLIGLLGTVWGIMRAFNDMALTGSAAPSVVAAGVAEALVTTAAGLIIAVPSVLLFNHFNRRMNIMLTMSENHTRSLRIALTEAAESSTNENSPRPTAAGEKEDFPTSPLEQAVRETLVSVVD